VVKHNMLKDHQQMRSTTKSLYTLDHITLQHPLMFRARNLPSVWTQHESLRKALMWWRKGAKRCIWSCTGNCIVTSTTRSVLHKKAAVQLYLSAQNSTKWIAPSFCIIACSLSYDTCVDPSKASSSQNAR